MTPEKPNTLTNDAWHHIRPTIIKLQSLEFGQVHTVHFPTPELTQRFRDWLYKYFREMNLKSHFKVYRPAPLMLNITKVQTMQMITSDFAENFIIQNLDVERLSYQEAISSLDHFQPTLSNHQKQLIAQSLQRSYETTEQEEIDKELLSEQVTMEDIKAFRIAKAGGYITDLPESKRPERSDSIHKQNTEDPFASIGRGPDPNDKNKDKSKSRYNPMDSGAPLPWQDKPNNKEDK